MPEQPWKYLQVGMAFILTDLSDPSSTIRRTLEDHAPVTERREEINAHCCAPAPTWTASPSTPSRGRSRRGSRQGSLCAMTAPEDIDAVTDNLLEAQDRAEGMVGDAIHVPIREAAGVLVGVQYVDEVVGGGTFDF